MGMILAFRTTNDADVRAVLDRPKRIEKLHFGKETPEPEPSVRSADHLRELTMPKIHIRAASEIDLPALRSIAEATFRETFSVDNQPADMEQYLRDAFGESQMSAELSDPANTFFLAWTEPSGSPVGYAKLRDGTPHPCVVGHDPVEIERIYVDASALGCGVGAALMQALLTAARALNRRTVWLGVWEHNPHAISFYRRWGFETVGSHTFRLGSDDQNDLIMARPVVNATTLAPTKLE